MNKSNPVEVLKYLVPVYELARAGLGDVQIAAALPVSYPTFKRWKDRYPEFTEALERARASPEVSGTVQDYVYEHLPKRLRKVWREIIRCEKGASVIERVEAMLKECGRKGRQHLFLFALLKSNYNMSKACKRVNIRKKEFTKWLLEDPEFAELVEEVEWHKGNFFENAYIKLVKSGHPAAVIQANKTYNAHRGYGDKKTVTKNVNVNGQVSHLHTPVPIEALNLDFEAKKQLLRALREHKQEQNPETPDE
jgi:hypothetical protein